jgi:hypothetical protein
MSDRQAKEALFDAFADVAKALANGRRAELIDILAQGEDTSTTSPPRSATASPTRRAAIASRGVAIDPRSSRSSFTIAGGWHADRRGLDALPGRRHARGRRRSGIAMT